MTKCPGVVLVMGIGDEGVDLILLEEQVSAEDIRELSLSGHLKNTSALGSPCVPTVITLFAWSSYRTTLCVSCDSRSLITLSQKLYEAEFCCVQ